MRVYSIISSADSRVQRVDISRHMQSESQCLRPL